MDWWTSSSAGPADVGAFGSGVNPVELQPNPLAQVPNVCALVGSSPPPPASLFDPWLNCDDLDLSAILQHQVTASSSSNSNHPNTSAPTSNSNNPNVSSIGVNSKNSAISPFGGSPPQVSQSIQTGTSSILMSSASDFHVSSGNHLNHNHNHQNNNNNNHHPHHHHHQHLNNNKSRILSIISNSAAPNSPTAASEASHFQHQQQQQQQQQQQRHHQQQQHRHAHQKPAITSQSLESNSLGSSPIGSTNSSYPHSLSPRSPSISSLTPNTNVSARTNTNNQRGASSMLLSGQSSQLEVRDPAVNHYTRSEVKSSGGRQQSGAPANNCLPPRQPPSSSPGHYVSRPTCCVDGAKRGVQHEQQHHLSHQQQQQQQQEGLAYQACETVASDAIQCHQQQESRQKVSLELRAGGRLTPKAELMLPSATGSLLLTKGSSAKQARHARKSTATSAGGSTSTAAREVAADATRTQTSGKMRRCRHITDYVLAEEEKRLLIKEGHSDFPMTCETRPLSKAEERILRKIRRKIRNKRSAQCSRQRKKEYVEDLERRYGEVVRENEQLKQMITRLQQHQHQHLHHYDQQQETQHQPHQHQHQHIYQQHPHHQDPQLVMQSRDKQKDLFRDDVCHEGLSSNESADIINWMNLAQSQTNTSRELAINSSHTEQSQRV